MSILQRLKSWWMGSQQNHTYTYTLGEPVQLIQTERADQETEPNFGDVSAVRPPRQEFEYEVYQRWLGLSPREQQVTAFTCLGYTNRQMAYRLGISESTVKSYLQNTLNKFGVHSKIELRLIFVHVDFSKWEQ
jgi:DNA-binding NarL/FixJ family response regulator